MALAERFFFVGAAWRRDNVVNDLALTREDVSARRDPRLVDAPSAPCLAILATLDAAERFFEVFRTFPLLFFDAGTDALHSPHEARERPDFGSRWYLIPCSIANAL